MRPIKIVSAVLSFTSFSWFFHSSSSKSWLFCKWKCTIILKTLLTFVIPGNPFSSDSSTLPTQMTKQAVSAGSFDFSVHVWFHGWPLGSSELRQTCFLEAQMFSHELPERHNWDWYPGVIFHMWAVSDQCRTGFSVSISYFFFWGGVIIYFYSYSKKKNSNIFDIRCTSQVSKMR